MNWGKGIALVFIVFALALFFLVYKTTEKTSEMVTEQYYEKELEYNTVINGKTNLNKLGNIKVEQQNDSIYLLFPSEFITKKIDGELYFYKPNNAKQDYKQAITLNEQAQQYISNKKLSSGIYQLQIQFKVDTIPYYQEQTINIP